MMTNEQRATVAELKAALAASVPAAGGAPQEVRTAAIALKREFRDAGMTAGSLADELGVHVTTLCRWESESRRASAARGVASPRRRAPARGERPAEGPGFRMVQVMAPAARTVPAKTARGLRVAHAPSGLVVDGLDVETLAALLRRLS